MSRPPRKTPQYDLIARRQIEAGQMFIDGLNISQIARALGCHHDSIRKDLIAMDLIDPGVHGTVAGYRRHLRNNECPCDPCAAAAHEKEAARWAKQKTAVPPPAEP